MRRLLALSLLFLSAACDEPSAPVERVELAGRWNAERIVVGAAPDTTDLIEAGAYLSLEIREDGTTTGAFTNPVGAASRPLWSDVTLEGTWSAVSRDTVLLKHDADSPVRGIPLRFSDGRLAGSGLVDGHKVSVVLVKEEGGSGVTPR